MKGATPKVQRALYSSVCSPPGHTRPLWCRLERIGFCLCQVRPRRGVAVGLRPVEFANVVKQQAKEQETLKAENAGLRAEMAEAKE